MSMTDPIADYLTRIRNAQSAQKNWVDIPASNMKKRISFVLKEEKFIRDFILIKDNKQDILRSIRNYFIAHYKDIDTRPDYGYLDAKKIYKE